MTWPITLTNVTKFTSYMKEINNCDLNYYFLDEFWYIHSIKNDFIFWAQTVEILKLTSESVDCVMSTNLA